MITRNPDVIVAGDYTQTHFPIGPNRDAYYLYSSFTLDVASGIIATVFSVEKNSMSENRRQIVHRGTDAKEALAALDAVVQPGIKYMHLYDVQKKEEYFRLTGRDAYKLTPHEQMIFEMGEAYLTQ